MGLPKWWWDEVLGGKPYEVDLRNTPFKNLMALRSACYREADSRQRLVVTSKRGIWTLAVQAWGNPDLPQMPQVMPMLTRDVETRPAPDRLARSSIPQRPGNLPAPQDQPPSTVEPPEDEAEALLGPCTCGHDPKCLPSCERFS